MQVEARTFCQPAADQLGFVGAVVIEDEMYVKFRGHVLLDGVEKAVEDQAGQMIIERGTPVVLVRDDVGNAARNVAFLFGGGQGSHGGGRGCRGLRRGRIRCREAA